MSDTPRLANIGKYMRDRYTSDLDGEKRAMVEAQLKRASREDLEKVAKDNWFESAYQQHAPDFMKKVDTGFLRGLDKVKNYFSPPKQTDPGAAQRAADFRAKRGGPKIGKPPETHHQRQMKREKQEVAAIKARRGGGTGGKVQQAGRAVGGQAAPGARAGQPGKKPGTLNP